MSVCCLERGRAGGWEHLSASECVATRREGRRLGGGERKSVFVLMWIRCERMGVLTVL